MDRRKLKKRGISSAFRRLISFRLTLAPPIEFGDLVRDLFAAVLVILVAAFLLFFTTMLDHWFGLGLLEARSLFVSSVLMLPNIWAIVSILYVVTFAVPMICFRGVVLLVRGLKNRSE